MTIKRALTATIVIAISLIIYVHSSDAADYRDIINHVFEKKAGKRSNKIDINCYFEGMRIPQRFEGMYTTSSEYLDGGAGTATFVEANKPIQVTFKRRRSSDPKSYGNLYIYEKDGVSASVYQIDEEGRAIAVRQQAPTTDPLPFTDLYTGTCYGVY
jgi:hypothetical protein